MEHFGCGARSYGLKHCKLRCVVRARGLKDGRHQVCHVIMGRSTPYISRLIVSTCTFQYAQRQLMMTHKIYLIWKYFGKLCTMRLLIWRSILVSAYQVGCLLMHMYETVASLLQAHVWDYSRLRYTYSFLFLKSWIVINSWSTESMDPFSNEDVEMVLVKIVCNEN